MPYLGSLITGPSLFGAALLFLGLLTVNPMLAMAGAVIAAAFIVMALNDSDE